MQALFCKNVINVMCNQINMITTLQLQAKHSQSQCSVRALIGVHLHHSVLWISWQHWQLLNGKQLVRKYIFKIFERVTLHPSGVARPALPVPVSSYMRQIRYCTITVEESLGL